MTGNVEHHVELARHALEVAVLFTDDKSRKKIEKVIHAIEKLEHENDIVVK